MTQLQARVQLQHSSGFQLELDQRIPATGISAVYGPSGCGKTSLLYCLAGLLRAGGNSEIRFGERVWQRGDEFLPAHQRRVGFVFQDARLFPHLSVSGNLTYADKRRDGEDGPSRAQVVGWLDLENL